MAANFASYKVSTSRPVTAYLFFFLLCVVLYDFVDFVIKKVLIFSSLSGTMHVTTIKFTTICMHVLALINYRGYMYTLMKYRANTCRPMRNMTENAGLKNAGPC